MHRITYKYRIYPNSSQRHSMEQILNECRWLYNYLLEQKRNSWEQNRKNTSMYDQINNLSILKRETPCLLVVHSQVLQNVVTRVNFAFKGFFRRVKAGEKPGYPRFRGAGQYNSFTYPQSGFSIKADSIYLSKIGRVKAKIHRPVTGNIKTCCIKHKSINKWYIAFSCEIEDAFLPKSNSAIGIDVGLKSFATLSNGESITNPQFFKTSKKVLIKAQRKVSKCVKETIARERANKAVAHIHEKIASKRFNFAHQVSRKIINQYGIIVVEDLDISQMRQNHCLAKSISDAAWGQFAKYLAYKAENAGRQFIAVNPAYTSQDCSRCGHRQKIPLSSRVFNCPCCYLSIDRDYNASLNILARGLASLGSKSVEAASLPGRVVTSHIDTII